MDAAVAQEMIGKPFKLVRDEAEAHKKAWDTRGRHSELAARSPHAAAVQTRLDEKYPGRASIHYIEDQDLTKPPVHGKVHARMNVLDATGAHMISSAIDLTPDEARAVHEEIVRAAGRMEAENAWRKRYNAVAKAERERMSQWEREQRAKGHDVR